MDMVLNELWWRLLSDLEDDRPDDDLALIRDLEELVERLERIASEN